LLSQDLMQGFLLQWRTTFAAAASKALFSPRPDDSWRDAIWEKCIFSGLWACSKLVEIRCWGSDSL